MSSRHATGIVGAYGFVGTAVCQAVERRGGLAIRLPRAQLPTGLTTSALPVERARLRDAALASNSNLLDSLRGVRTLINAAGSADPTSSDSDQLKRSNVLLPAVVDFLAQEAGVERVVHISSAAVQGDQPLNERPEWFPITPYGKSKAEAEQYLLESAVAPTSIYRATSVMGPGRPIVDRLVKFYGGRLVPVFGDGSAPLPLSALPNTANAVVELSRSRTLIDIALQPFEGVTQMGLAESLSQPTTRTVRVPLPACSDRLGHIPAGLPAGLTAKLRRASLVVFGQPQEATALQRCGYQIQTATLEYLRSLKV